MSRKQKTFAPRSGHEYNYFHDEEYEEVYLNTVEISEEDVNTPIPKDEAFSLMYEGFRNRAFQKIMDENAVVEVYDQGPHIAIIKRALDEKGYTMKDHSDSFDESSKDQVSTFRSDHGMIGIARIDADMIRALDQILQEDKAEQETAVVEETDQEQEGTGLPEQTSHSQEKDALSKENQPANDDGKIRLNIGFVPHTINSKKALIVYFNLKVFGKLTNHKWNIPEGKPFTDYLGKSVYVKIRKSALLKGWGISAAEWEDLGRKSLTESDKAETLRRSVEKYRQEGDKRASDNFDKGLLETKLYGLEDLYKAYEQYVEAIKTSNTNNAIALSNMNTGMGANFSSVFIQNEQRVKLDESAKKHGFKDLSDFEKTVRKYEEAFTRSLQNNLNDYLQLYEHTLYDEEKRLTDDAHVTALFKQLNDSKIKNTYSSLEALRDDPNRYEKVMVNAVNDSYARVDRNKNKIANRKQQLKNYIGELNTILVKDGDESSGNDIDYERLAQVKNKAEMKSIFQGYIQRKREALATTREDIAAHPEHVYELTELISLAYKQQNIETGSIYDLIIQDKQSKIASKKLLIGITLAVVSIAIVIATWGAATPFVAAGAAASLGISAFGVYEALEDYSRKDAAHEILLLKDDPSLVWVVVAIAAAALDAAALAAVFKSAKPIVEASKVFNETGDIVTLEAQLTKIEGLSSKGRASILRQAKLEKEGKIAAHEFRLAMATANEWVNPAALPKLIKMAKIEIEKGYHAFKQFLYRLEAEKIIKNSDDLTEEELKILKEAHDEAKFSTKSKDAVPENSIDDTAKEELKVSSNSDEIEANKFDENGGKTSRLSEAEQEDLINEKLGDFYLAERHPIITNMVEDAAVKGDYDALGKMFGLDESLKGKNMWSSGKSYEVGGSNVYEGEHLGKYEEFIDIKYFNETERQVFEVFVKDGQLYNKNMGLLKNSKEDIIFVLGRDGKIYAKGQKIGVIHHTSFLAGEKVATAGEFKFIDGILSINNQSGHYRPLEPTLKNIVEELTNRGVDINKIKIK